MTHYLLDTNAVISLLNNPADSALAKKVRSCKPSDVSISSIVIYELFYGAFKSQRCQHNLAIVDSLRFEVLEFDKEDARQAGEIRATLALIGKPIGPYDILIAGQAKARQMTLVTHNTAEFSRIKGLKLQDWEKS